MNDFWNPPKQPEAIKEATPERLGEYAKSQEFRSILQTDYKTTIQPTVYGCAISYDMSATYSGEVDPWSWGATEYENGGYHIDGSPKIVVPSGLGGLYLVLGDARILNSSGQLGVVALRVVSPSGTVSALATYSSSPGVPVGIWTAATFESANFSFNRIMQLNDGDAVSLSGGMDGTWSCALADNQLSIIKFPFGS